MEKLTPLMQQYFDVKSRHPDKVVLFRMGDFFEMFHDDALTVAPILGITLTVRNKKAEDQTPMCGVPHHAVAGPIAKLLAHGHRVAICDQIEDPKLAKGIVKRAVTRVLTPGMVYDPDTLNELQANYICASDPQTVAFAEASTGECFFYRAGEEARARLTALLNPAEILIEDHPTSEEPRRWSIYRVDEAFVLPGEKDLPDSCRLLLSYMRQMQNNPALELPPFVERQLNDVLELAPSTIKHLEMFVDYDGETKGALFEAVNRTRSSAGARMLRNWLRFPLRDSASIQARWDEIDWWRAHPLELARAREMLGRVGDLERRLARIEMPQAGPRDLWLLGRGLELGLELERCRWESEPEDAASGEVLRELARTIDRVLIDDPPTGAGAGGFVRPGVSAALDEYIDLAQNAQSRLLELEARERELTGIASLKIRYNSVFGYYIEVTNTHREKVPSRYFRKQTLANAERYLTEELQQLETKILAANHKREELEAEIFRDLRRQVVARKLDVLGKAGLWARMDVVSSWAWLALERRYVRPEWTDGDLELTQSRHPVVEQVLAGRFVPNDICLNSQGALLLTGPNMAGKSTLMRQAALACILAQAGCFVPAERARVPILDRICTRIGSSDSLSRGLSTFMVEMKETADLLRAAGPRSLLVLDEIGRGTSTYDGLSLAQAILEHLLTRAPAMTLFATHYHELTALESEHPRLKNAHMRIMDGKTGIEFLYVLNSGPAERSYGVQVARLAGLPASVVTRAARLLAELEEGRFSKGASQMELWRSAPLPARTAAAAEPSRSDVAGRTMSAVNEEHAILAQEMLALAIDELRPIDALAKLAAWKDRLLKARARDESH